MRGPALARNLSVMDASNDNLIKGDKEHQVGRRKQEIEYDGVLFPRDSIVPPDDSGTLENPILVPSGEQVRTVGFEDPQTHAILWFNLEAGHPHFIPNLGLYFKLWEIKNETYE